LFLLLPAFAVASEIGPDFSPGITDQPRIPSALPKAGVKAQPERLDLSPLPLPLLLPLPLFLPLFTPQSTPSELFFALLLSKIACQAPKLTKKPITQSLSTT
jgi:hypothetical protein